MTTRRWRTVSPGIGWSRFGTRPGGAGAIRDNVTYTANQRRTNRRQSSHTLVTSVSVPFDTPATYFVYHIDRGGLASVARRLDFIVYSGASVDEPTTPPAWWRTTPHRAISPPYIEARVGSNCDRFVVRTGERQRCLIRNRLAGREHCAGRHADDDVGRIDVRGTARYHVWREDQRPRHQRQLVGLERCCLLVHHQRRAVGADHHVAGPDTLSVTGGH